VHTADIHGRAELNAAGDQLRAAVGLEDTESAQRARPTHGIRPRIVRCRPGSHRFDGQPSGGDQQAEAQQQDEQRTDSGRSSA
jgi:hypothetical protein